MTLALSNEATVLSADLGPVPVEINRLDNQLLVRYYEAEWRRYE
jgi:spermidine synthase